MTTTIVIVCIVLFLLWKTLSAVSKPSGINEPEVKEIEKLGYTPEELFKALGVEVKNKTEVEEDGVTHYLIVYQGGYFKISFSKNSKWTDMAFYNFYECKFEHSVMAMTTANYMNNRYRGWTCCIDVSENSEMGEVVNANLTFGFIQHDDLETDKQHIRAMMGTAFHIAHDYSEELNKKIQNHDLLNEEFLNDRAFYNDIARIQWMKTMDKLGEETEENSDSSALSVNALVRLFDNADFGCLQSLRIVCGEEVEMVTDISAIEAFDIRKYVRQRPDASTIESINLTFGFEYQEMFMNLTKAKASTDKSLIFVVNIVRSGIELDKQMDNRIPFSSRTMLEVRLTDEDKDYWEAKYMVDEAMDLVKNGRLDKLTNEQRLVVAYANPTVQTDLYWGKKFYNNRCYFQALYHFNRVFAYFKNNPNNWNEAINNLYCEVAFYIGFIYDDLGMYDRAFFYLYIAQRTRIDGTQEFVNCLCNMKDVGAKGYIHSQAEEVMTQMKKSEEEAERLTPLYNFLRRRYAYVLIDRGELDDAERMLNDMIADEQDVEFAKGELEYIKKIRDEEANLGKEEN